MSLCKPLIPAILLLNCILTLVPLNSSANSTQAKLAEIESLLNWAVHLSAYEKPDKVPEIRFVDHDYLVLRACFGKECQVIGWYDDKNVIYIDKALSSLDSLMDRSVVVHEMVHFLQHKSGRFSTGCVDNAMREREAYELQRQYFYAYGALSPVRNHDYHCKPEIEPEIQAATVD